MRASTLEQVERQYREAAGLAELAREERNSAVRQAAWDGMTHAEISRATGLTRARVGQIALPPRSDAGS